MKFTIEIDEFWLDGEEELEPALRSHIIGEVVVQVKKSIKSQVDETITKAVLEKLNKAFDDRISILVDEIIEKETVTYGWSPVPVKEALRKIFESKAQYYNPQRKMEQLGEEFAKEFYNRYDLVFATQVVSKMRQLDMLKPEVAHALLGEQKPEAQ